MFSRSETSMWTPLPSLFKIINTGTCVYGCVHIMSLAVSALPPYPLLPAFLSNSLAEERPTGRRTDRLFIPYHIISSIRRENGRQRTKRGRNDSECILDKKSSLTIANSDNRCPQILHSSLLTPLRLPHQCRHLPSQLRNPWESMCFREKFRL
jgi:hypothetical protein